VNGAKILEINVALRMHPLDVATVSILMHVFPLALSDDHLPGEDTESIAMVLFLSYHNSSGILGLDCAWLGVQLKLGFVRSINNGWCKE